MTAFVVRFGAGLTARRFLAHADTAGDIVNGWRPLVWTKDIQRAEIFGSEEAATTFARQKLGHDRWAVVVAPSRGVPTDDLGGTPAAIRMAA